MDLGWLTHQSIPVAVHVVRFERALGEAVCRHPLHAYRFDEKDVLLDEGVPGGVEDFGPRHSQPVDPFGGQATLGEGFVELRPTAMDHDRRQPNGMEKGECGGGLVEMVAHDRAADLDDREPGAVDLGEPL